MQTEIKFKLNKPWYMCKILSSPFNNKQGSTLTLPGNLNVYEAILIKETDINYEMIIMQFNDEIEKHPMKVEINKEVLEISK